MILENPLRAQFGRPSGLFGSLFIAPLLNFANMPLMNLAVELLAPEPQDEVLDVGFGGGHTLVELARRVTRGQITGVDYSPDMVSRAGDLIARYHLESRVTLQCADVAELPFARGTFDKALAVSTVYYWPDVGRGLRELARVLKPHGRIAVGFHSRSNLRLFTLGWDRFTLYDPKEFARILEKAGFSEIEIEHRDRWQILDSVVVTGRRR